MRTGRLVGVAAACVVLVLAGCGSPSKSGVPTSVPSTTSSNADATTTVPSSTVAPSTAIAQAGTAAPTTTLPAQPPGCLTDNLRLSSGGGIGAGGTGYTTYDLTNVGAGTCTIIGYPGVAVLDAAGHIVQHAAVRRPGSTGSATVPVAVVTLASGQRAMFLVTTTDTVPNPDCAKAYTGTTFEVYPPNQTKPILQPYHGVFCDLVVGPVEAATTQVSYSAIAGTYGAGTADGGSLYVRSDGASRFSGPDVVACPSCSTASAPIATLDFSLSTLSSTGARAYRATGTITAESDPAWAGELGTGPPGAGPVGTAVSLTVSSSGALVLSFLPTDDVLERIPAG